MQKYQPGQDEPGNPAPSPNEGEVQHNTLEGHPERIMYQQEGVDQEVIQPGEHMHFVDNSQSGR